MVEFPRVTRRMMSVHESHVARRSGAVREGRAPSMPPRVFEVHASIM